mmetsp:Transcript_13966/g.29243  ORF Transcript_13966/g.29243 Transcript_13966/m.29243 type:complete len:207 (-) Transcript_13966:152-772(-)
MVTLGEDPGIEVWGDVLTDVHLGPFLVVLHLLLIDLHALLEGNGILVIPCLDVLGDTAVRTVSADDNIHFQGLLFALPCVPILIGEVVVGQDIRVFLPLWQGHPHEEAVDNICAVLSRPVSQEGVQDLASQHPNELIVLQRLTDLHLLVRRGDHGHLPHFPVNNVWRQVKLINHAEWDGSTAGLAVIHFALDQVGLDARACKRVST